MIINIYIYIYIEEYSRIKHIILEYIKLSLTQFLTRRNEDRNQDIKKSNILIEEKKIDKIKISRVKYTDKFNPYKK